MKRLPVLWLLLCSIFVLPGLYAQEICDNGIDDDGDLLVDCLDPDCGTNVVSSHLVQQSSDDAEEDVGIVELADGGPTFDLDFRPGKVIGIRYSGLAIPSGSIITNAYITFTASSNEVGATGIPVYAEANLNSYTYEEEDNDVSDRVRTTATLTWDTGPWTTGTTYNTPNLSAIVQEVVDSVPYGQALMSLNFVFDSAATGKASAWAYEGGNALSPVLHLEYGSCFQEICDNGIDDDFDGLVDCGDPDCGTANTIDIPVGQLSDDAEENGGTVSLNEVGPISDLDLEPGVTSGVRFRNLSIPFGAVVTNAYITFTASSNEVGATNIPISAELNLNSQTYQELVGNITTRTKTASNVSWTTTAWTNGQTYDTPDLSAMAQEVIDLLSPGQELTSLNFIFDPAASGKVSAWGFEGGSTVVAMLHLEYGSCGPEICNNGIDDDFDGLIDCYDTDCVTDPSCAFYVDYTCTTTTNPDTVCIAELSRSANGYQNRLTVMVADVDQDSSVEIIALQRDNQGIDILNPITMAVEHTLPSVHTNRSNVLLVAQLDGVGYMEVAYVRNTRKIEVFRHNGATWDVISSSENAWPAVDTVNNINGLGTADFNSDGRPELYMSNRIFGFEPDASCTGTCIELLFDGDTTANGGARGSTNYSAFSTVAIDILSRADCGGDPECDGLELVAGYNVYSMDLANKTMTARRNLNDAGSGNFYDGQTAVADVNLDGLLDVIVHGPYGSAFGLPVDTGALYVWTPATNTLLAGWTSIVDRGVPIVAQVYDDDLADDGDKTNGSTPNPPEIVLLTPNIMRCYNTNQLTGPIWSQPVIDQSGSTGITSFDFNGDGIDEITYRDEDNLRIMYGGPLAFMPTGVNPATRDYGSPIACLSATSNEYPTIADVDDDGEAELVITCNKAIVIYESGCTPWLQARKIWNQFYYYGVNINDDGTVPVSQQQTLAEISPGTGFQPLNRTNFQISSYQFSNLIGVGPGGTNLVPAPDLTGSIATVDNTLGCGLLGNQLVVTYEISNQGNLTLPAGISVAFYQGDPTQAGAVFLDQDVMPIAIQVDSTKSFTVIIPDPGVAFDLYMVINDDGSQPLPLSQPLASEAECDYNNNFITVGDICGTPLDVEWLSFDASWPDLEGVHLSWTVLETDYIHRYQVERSLEGEHFYPISEVLAVAEDGQNQSYQSWDYGADQTGRDILYYRIRLTNLAGDSYLSPVRQVQRGSHERNIWFDLYTEGNEVNIRYTQPRLLASHVEILNGLGQVVHVEALPEGRLAGEINIHTANWAKGFYFARFKGVQNIPAEKFWLR